MTDVGDVATKGGLTSAAIAIVVAIAEYIKRRDIKKLEDKYKNLAPSPPPLVIEKPTDLTFEKSRAIPSIDMIAHVESYVRAEGELRIQLARKDWEIKELVDERDKLYAQVRGLRQELEELRRGLESGNERIPRYRPARTVDPSSDSSGGNLPGALRVDRPYDRKGPRKDDKR